MQHAGNIIKQHCKLAALLCNARTAATLLNPDLPVHNHIEGTSIIHKHNMLWLGLPSTVVNMAGYCCHRTC